MGSYVNLISKQTNKKWSLTTELEDQRKGWQRRAATEGRIKSSEFWVENVRKN